MYKCINGWTKNKMLKVIKARRYNTPAMKKDDYTCEYLTPNGNKCGVGLFIPRGVVPIGFFGDSDDLVDAYPELKDVLPLGKKGMSKFQECHDNEAFKDLMEFNGNAKAAMLAWVKENVE